MNGGMNSRRHVEEMKTDKSKRVEKNILSTHGGEKGANDAPLISCLLLLHKKKREKKNWLFFSRTSFHNVIVRGLVSSIFFLSLVNLTMMYLLLDYYIMWHVDGFILVSVFCLQMEKEARIRRYLVASLFATRKDYGSRSTLLLLDNMYVWAVVFTNKTHFMQYYRPAIEHFVGL